MFKRHGRWRSENAKDGGYIKDFSRPTAGITETWSMTIDTLAHFPCISVAQYPIISLRTILCHNSVSHELVCMLWDWLDERYFLSFERSKLDGKYSLIVSVCMHACLVAEECCFGYCILFGDWMSMFMHAWVVWTSFAGYLEWMS